MRICKEIANAVWNEITCAWYMSWSDRFFLLLGLFIIATLWMAALKVVHWAWS